MEVGLGVRVRTQLAHRARAVRVATPPLRDVIGEESLVRARATARARVRVRVRARARARVRVRVRVRVRARVRTWK